MKLRFAILSIISFGVCLFSLYAAPTPISPFALTGVEREILLSVRLPRIIIAALMGSALGASGAVLQGFLRNPLADPYILGLSSGAALAAAAGLMFGLGAFSTPVLAFVGALVTGAVVGMMGIKKGGILPERLLLAGIGMSFLFSALLTLMMSIATDEGLRRAVLWMFGDLSIAEWKLLPGGLVLITIGFILAYSRSKGLNALMLGDELAWSLGFSPDRERFILFLAVCLMTASSVSLGGMIGFIGLLMPHIMRFFVGSDNRMLIPASALAGGTLLVLADLVARTIISPVELPSGIVTAMLGAPYFLYLLRRREVLHG